MNINEMGLKNYNKCKFDRQAVMHSISVSEINKAAWPEPNVLQEETRWARNNPSLPRRSPEVRQATNQHSISHIGIDLGQSH